MTKNVKLNLRNKTALLCHIFAPIVILGSVVCMDAIAAYINHVDVLNPPI